jgi:hypothetical protein
MIGRLYPDCQVPVHPPDDSGSFPAGTSSTIALLRSFITSQPTTSSRHPSLSPRFPLYDLRFCHFSFHGPSLSPHPVLVSQLHLPHRRATEMLPTVFLSFRSPIAHFCPRLRFVALQTKRSSR